MKKIILSIVLVFLSVTMINANDFILVQNDDCFDSAIQDLEQMEDVIGITYNQRDATDFLNESYMICWFMDHIDYCMDNW
ncbi:MAG: hypothetical protein GZ086_06880 [Gelidibacter sp.]|nr:hypothetical protein [Gelidibacter sp.]